jgi:Xaa-Pro dipeptidase
MDIGAVQVALREREIDGWLLYDFHGSNPIARRLVGVAGEGMTTRRWFYFVPQSGAPQGLVHAIEPQALSDAPGERIVYTSWRDLELGLQRLLQGRQRVAMEYSPGGAIPYVSRVDAGTIELVRRSGVEVVSSANLIQVFEARWSARQKALHDQAARLVLATKDDAFSLVARQLRSGAPVRESELQAFVSEGLEKRGLTFDHPCIVAVNDHAANPHFEPEAGADDRVIRSGDLLLLDVWAKVESEVDAVYYDTTWMAFCGGSLPPRIAEVWRVVAGARDAAVECLRQAHRKGTHLRGCDVDDAARGYIEARGFGPYFLHRTGHSIGTEVHGNGANIDNLETRDERELISGTGFSIEPGVYLPELGVRSEIDVFMSEAGPEVTGAIQNAPELLVTEKSLATER